MEILRVPFQQQIPQAFKYRNALGKEEIVGPYAQIIKQFAYYQNFSLLLDYLENYEVADVQRKIENNFYNLSMHGGVYYNQFANIKFSYAIEWSKICIMVPAEYELPKYWYVVWPFDRYIWTLLALSIFYVAFLMKYLQQPTTSFVKNLLYSLALILPLANGNFKFINLKLRMQCFYALVLANSFILSAYYSSYLPAYNMRPVFQRSLETLDDILQSKIKVLIPSQILEELNNNKYVDLMPLEPAFQEMTQLEVSSYIANFSRSFAFVINQHDWMFLIKLQRNLIQPLYHLSNVCYGNILTTFPLQLESKFAKSLDMFILFVQQSGLWEQWKEEAFLAAISAKYYHIFEDEYLVKPLNFMFFKIAWIILVWGMALSSICAIVEIKVFSYKMKKIKFDYTN